MDELKERLLKIELTDKEMKAFIEQCHKDGITPAEVLEGFICDLTGVGRTRGSDEREIADRYYSRCGYPFMNYRKDHTFTQWLLFTSYSLEGVADLLKDIEALKGSTAQDDIEDLEAYQYEINEIYKEYTKSVRKPEDYETAIKGVLEYQDMIDRIQEGGTI